MVSFNLLPEDSGVVVIRMTICLMLLRFDARVSCDLTSSAIRPNSVGGFVGEGGGSWVLPIAARKLSLLNVALLLERSGEPMSGGGCGISGGGSGICRSLEVVRELEGESDSLVAGAGGGTFSLPTDGDGTPIFETLALSDAREPRFRGLSFSFGLGWTLTASESLPEAI